METTTRGGDPLPGTEGTGAFDLEWSPWREVRSTRLGIDVPERVAQATAEWDGLWRAATRWLQAQGYRLRETAEGRREVVHTPRAAVERRILEAFIAQLAGDDPDGARERNHSGFNRQDCAPGHDLAARIGAWDGGDHEAARRMCRKYHRQVGGAGYRIVYGARGRAAA